MARWERTSPPLHPQHKPGDGEQPAPAPSSCPRTQELRAQTLVPKTTPHDPLPSRWAEESLPDLGGSPGGLQLDKRQAAQGRGWWGQPRPGPLLDKPSAKPLYPQLCKPEHKSVAGGEEPQVNTESSCSPAGHSAARWPSGPGGSGKLPRPRDCQGKPLTWATNWKPFTASKQTLSQALRRVSTHPLPGAWGGTPGSRDPAAQGWPGPGSTSGPSRITRRHQRTGTPSEGASTVCRSLPLLATLHHTHPAASLPTQAPPPGPCGWASSPCSLLGPVPGVRSPLQPGLLQSTGASSGTRPAPEQENLPPAEPTADGPAAE